MSEPSPRVIEVDRDSFEREVIERSAERPVVVDFWATWCQPCRILGPVLESLADEFAGRIAVVKVETERAPEIAARFGVRSIPAVFGFRDGEVVDSFVGVLPERAIRAWMERLLPSPAEALVAEAARLEAADPDAAEAKYREAIALGEDLDRPKLRLASLLLSRDRLDEAGSVLSTLGSRGLLDSEAERLQAELRVKAAGRDGGGLAALRAAFAANPDDHALRLRLAGALAAASEFPEALDLFLDVVERGRGDVREAARKGMVDLFRIVEDDELVREYQRKLAAALF